jgi:tetratricopeptide (TPR) repeat protein
MNHIRKFPFVLIIFIIISTSLGWGQQKSIDSLISKLEETKEISDKIDLHLKIGREYENKSNDTALYFYQKVIQLTQNNDNPQNQIRYARALQKIAYVHGVYLSNYDTAILLTNKALSILNEISVLTENSTFSDNDTLKAISYNHLGEYYQSKGNFDTAIYLSNQALKIHTDIQYTRGLAKSYGTLAALYQRKGDFSNSIEYFKKAIQYTKELGDLEEMYKLYNNLGLAYWRKGNYDKAIELFIQALKYNESQGNIRAIASNSINIGIIYFEQKEFEKALEYFKIALEKVEELNLSGGMSICYNNIGACYSQLNNYEKALEYHQNALKIRLEIGNKPFIATSYHNLGSVNEKMGNYNQALKYYQKALQIQKEIGDKNNIADSYDAIAETNLSWFYSQNIDYSSKTGKLKEALKYGEKALKIAQQIGAIPIQNKAASTLMKAAEQLGKPNKALKYAKLYIQTRDSLFSKEKTDALTEMQTKYETEKKQNEIEKQQIQIEKQEIVMKKQNLQRNALVGGLSLMLLVAFLVYRSYRQKKRANIIISEKNEHLEQANIEIEAQRDNITKQKERIEEIHTSLTKSIDYAQRIQNAVLPQKESLNNVLGEHFVLLKPHSIVSGDFYWVTKINDWLVFAVADCTGHGVPGAFMSMLGVSFLNEIVQKKEVNQANQILIQLRASIIESLKQKGITGEQKDGMDMAICVVDTSAGMLQFAGANNPLYLVRNNKFGAIPCDRQIESDERTLYEIKGNSMPIAIYRKMDDFTNHTIKIEPEDTVYLFSDGFADQFGGKENKKYKYKPFKHLLLENAHNDMDKQKAILDKTFEEWKGEYHQVDDVCIMGVRL